MEPYKTDSLDLRCMDNMELMKAYPENYFDLSVVDPPYGINHSVLAGKQSGSKYGKAAAAKSNYAVKDWDSDTPPVGYFNELKRVSKKQIIWGANHMMDKISSASSCWLVWDKDNGSNLFADAELAYTSFKTAVRIFKFTWNGMIQGDMKNKEKRIHPTQKPVKLYDWIFANYAEKGMKVLDTHLGSGSIAIAAHYAGVHLTGCELDEDYFNAMCVRVDRETMQTSFI